MRLVSVSIHSRYNKQPNKMEVCCVVKGVGCLSSELSSKKRRRQKSSKSKGGSGSKLTGDSDETDGNRLVALTGILVVVGMTLFFGLMFIVFFFLGAPVGISKSASLHAPNKTYFTVNDNHRPFVVYGPCTNTSAYDNTTVCGVLSNATFLALTEQQHAIDMRPINEIGFFGTHNSYHSGSWLCSLVKSGLPAEWCEKHPEYSEQWKSGATQYELDLNSQIYDVKNITFYVYHISLLDTQTNDVSLIRSLIEFLTYMRDSPRHAPIMIFFDPKGQTSPHDLCSKDTMVALHDLIKKVVPLEWVFAPKHVYTDLNTARSTVKTQGWPLLGSLRGSIMFVMSTYDQYNEPCAKAYRETYDLADQLMFTYIDSDSALDSEIFYMSSHDLEQADAENIITNEKRIVRFDTSPAPLGSDPHINDTISAGYNIIASHDNYANWCTALAGNHPVLREMGGSEALCHYMITGQLSNGS